MMLHATGTVGADWLITFLAYSTAILGGVSLARIVMQREFPEIVWRLAIVAALAAALPGSARFGSVIDLHAPLATLSRGWDAQAARFVRYDSEAPVPAQPAQPIATAPSKATATPVTRTESGVSGRVAVTMSDLRDSKSHAGRQWLSRPSHYSVLTLWLCVAGVLLAKLAFDYVRAARAFGRRTPLEPDHVAHELMRGLCASAGLRAVPALTVSRSLNSPVSLIGNEICIPDWALLDLDRDQLQGLLAHELAHQNRGDPLLFALLQVVERVFFFQPLFRAAHARLRILAELAADDWAAARTRNGPAIATTLYACVARSLECEPAFGIAMVTERSVLRHRVQRLLASNGAELRSIGRVATAGLVCLTLALALALPTFRTAQAQAAVPAPPAPPAPTAAPSAAPTPAALPSPDVAAPPDAVDAPAAVVTEPAPAAVVAAAPHAASVPAVPSAPAMPSLPSLPSVSSHLSINDDEGEFSHSAGGTELKVKWRGDFELNDAESDVTQLGHAGILEIETRDKGVTHRMEFAEHRGAIERTYYLNGKEQPPDDAGRAWLTGALKDFLRSSAVHGKERVVRLLKTGGNRAVLDEMDHMAGAYAMGLYTAQLVGQSDLSDDEIRRLCDQLARVDGDYDLRTALTAVLTQEHVSAKNMSDVLAVAKKIDGSYDRRVLLETVAQQPLTAPLLELYRELASGIGGDYDLRMAVVAALENAAVDGEGAATLLDLAARSLHADYDLSQVVQSTPQLHASDAATAAAIRAVGAIKSAYDQRISLVHVIDEGKLDQRGWLAIIDAATRIGSDYDRAETLTSIAAAMPLDDATKEAYRKAADAIGSEYDRSRAREALYERGA